jgi:hypothetical protein
MSPRPVFGIDRDPLAAASWGEQHGFGLDDDEPCEIHGDDRDACRRFDDEEAREARITEELAVALLGQPTP